jgi:2-dehydro-3-deoxy-D-arabinonate dehydratase
MRLGQIKWNDQIVAAIFEGELARPVPNYTVCDLIRRSEVESIPLTDLVTQLADPPEEVATPLIPIHPCEVWACGCTYKRSAVFHDHQTSATFHDAERGTRERLYAYVYKSQRPEIFFKGTARVCVGPGQPIGIRPDSRFTGPEPELAVVLGSEGKVLGYTLGNDVSAWDIERENPLYLPQSKVYTGCCSLGPVIVTTDELPDPYSLNVTCTVRRGGKTIFSGATCTSRLARRIEEMVEFLLRSNPVPAGSVLLTGTGIIVTKEAALAPGDIVSIQIPEIGELSNVARLV